MWLLMGLGGVSNTDRQNMGTLLYVEGKNKWSVRKPCCSANAVMATELFYFLTSVAVA